MIGAAVLAQRAAAAPFVPASDDQVLERLPDSVVPGVDPALRRRAGRATPPTDLPSALAIAGAQVRLARQEGDPRLLGRAEAVLRPWWTEAEPPVAVLVLRATVRQSLHDFDGALADLALAVDREPENGQAWLTGAMIQQTRGDYADAAESCRRLRAASVRSSEMRAVATVCALGVASFAGHAEDSREKLTQLLRLADALPGDVQLWASAVLADVATRLGHLDQAQRHYEAALALAPRDVTTRAAYADLLLERHSYAEALAVLGDDTRNDALLLRIALAERGLGRASAADRVAELRTRFAAAELRQDHRQLREEARFALRLLGEPEAALTLAQRNWDSQREPEDACLLLASATAAGDDATVGQVHAWVRERGLEDVRLPRCVTR